MAKTICKFTIPVKPVTKKNSQQIVMCKGRPIIVPSKLYKTYEKDVKAFIEPLKIDEPINVQAVYYMPSKRRIDLCNLHEALCDVLVKHGMVTDDNSNIIQSMDGSRVMYDKEHPRTEVTITKVTN